MKTAARRATQLLVLIVTLGIGLIGLRVCCSGQSGTGGFNSYRYYRGHRFANFPDFETPSAPEPLKNECVTSPFWPGNTVCKLTDVLGQWNPLNPAVFIEKIPVSRWTTENADGSLYYTQIAGDVPPKLGKGQLAIYRVSDNSLYAHPALTALDGQEFRWSDVNPAILYYIPIGTCQLASYNVETRLTTVIRDFKNDFPGCTTIRNDAEGAPSIGSRYWAWMVWGFPRFGNTRLLAVIVYDMKSDSIIGVLDRTKFIEQGGWPAMWDTYGAGGRPNMVDIAPSNDRVLVLWPSVTYPAPENLPVNAAPSKVANGKITLSSLPPFSMYFDVGDSIQFRYANSSATGAPGCSGVAGEALKGQYVIEAFPDPYTAVVDIAGSGLPDGTYSCTYVNPAILSVAVSRGMAVVTTGARHWLKAGDTITLFNTPDPAMNGKAASVAYVLDSKRFAIPTAAVDSTHTMPMMYYRDSRKGVAIPDTVAGYETVRPAGAANDGAHVYNLDFSHPLRVSNGQPHTGWAWDLNGDPLLLQQITQANWSGAPADSFGFTNIYTGKYTPVFFHADFNFEAGSIHQSRFYDRRIRGWGLFTLASRATDKSRIRNQALLVELTAYSEHPEIWRVGYLYNDYGCATVPADLRGRLNGCNPAKPYDTEAQVSLSRDGLSYYWGGLWQNGSNTVNVYRGTIPLRVKSKGSFEVINASETSVVASFIAPTADSACSVTTSLNSDYSAPVETAAAAGDQQLRKVTIGAAAPLKPGSRYYAKISCSWRASDPLSVSNEDIFGSFVTGRVIRVPQKK